MGLFSRRRKNVSLRAEVLYDEGTAIVSALRERGFGEDVLGPLGDLSTPVVGALHVVRSGDSSLAVFEADGGTALPAVDPRDGELGLSTTLTARMNGHWRGEPIRYQVRLTRGHDLGIVEELEEDDWLVAT